MAACRSCRAEIEWARTQLGRPMPLDPGVFDDGRVAVIGRAHDGKTPLVMSLSRDELDRARNEGRLELRRAHFQTCPDADAWRRA